MSKRKVAQYTLEFKQSSAKLASTSGKPVSQVAEELGVNSNTLHGWVAKYYPKATVEGRIAIPADLEAENRRLRKELARAKQERDILKKAAAYFANETR